MVRLVGAGTARRWKYHCETVAEVTERWIPKIMAMVQRYIRMKYAPSHHVEASMINRPTEERLERWPPKKTRVNIETQTQVHETIAARMANPWASRAGLAARMRVPNSSIEMAL